MVNKARFERLIGPSQLFNRRSGTKEVQLILVELTEYVLNAGTVEEINLFVKEIFENICN